MLEKPVNLPVYRCFLELILISVMFTTRICPVLLVSLSSVVVLTSVYREVIIVVFGLLCVFSIRFAFFVFEFYVIRALSLSS